VLEEMRDRSLKTRRVIVARLSQLGRMVGVLVAGMVLGENPGRSGVVGLMKQTAMSAFHNLVGVDHELLQKL